MSKQSRIQRKQKREQVNTHPLTEDEIAQALDRLIEQGLIKRTSKDHYKFTDLVLGGENATNYPDRK